MAQEIEQTTFDQQLATFADRLTDLASAVFAGASALRESPQIATHFDECGEQLARAAHACKRLIAQLPEVERQCAQGN